MFERCLYFNTTALARKVNKIWNEAFKEFDLSPSHAYLLRLVLADPGISPKEISQELKLEKSTITRFIDVLEGKKLLTRKGSAEGRALSIHPTAKAKKIETQLNEKGDELYSTMLAALGNDELGTLIKGLRKAEKTLKNR